MKAAMIETIERRVKELEAKIMEKQTELNNCGNIRTAPQIKQAIRSAQEAHKENLALLAALNPGMLQ